LLFRNETGKRGTLRIRYLRDNGARELELTKRVFPGSFLRLERPATRPVRIRPHEIVQLVFKATLPIKQRLSALDGTLVVEMKTMKPQPGMKASAHPTLPEASAARSLVRLQRHQPQGRTAGAAMGDSTLIRVAGALRPLEDVRPEPATVVVQITRQAPWSDPDPSAQVRLVGADAAALLAEEPNYTSTVLLRNDDGHDVAVTLSDLRNENGIVTATLKADDVPPPGKYTGALPLSAASAKPKIDVTVRSRHWWFWAVLAVLFGSLLGGLLPLMSGIWRRKELLRAELKGVLESYKDVRDNKAAPPQHWDLDDAVGPEPWFRDEWMALPELQGAAGLYSSIRWSRTDADLDEITAQVVDLTARISRWLRLNKPVRDLWDAFEQPVPDRGKKLWRETGTYHDTRLLLLEAKREPATDEAAEQLLHRVLEERQWHQSVATLWMAVADAQTDPRIPKPQRDAIAALDLTPVTNPEVPEARRAPEQQWELITELEALKARLETLKTLERQPVAELVEGAPLPTILIFGPRHVRDAIATFDRMIFARIKEARAASTASPDNRKPARIIAGVLWNEKWLTAVLTLGAVLAYVLPLYSSTWGSPTDYLTAIAAGFGAQAVVRWAALPAFESLRHHTTQQAETGTQATDGQGEPPKEKPAPASDKGGKDAGD
jgi:hypothetical protein